MADYSAYDAGDQISVVSGAPSFINQLSVDFHGTNCLDTPDFNKVINVENLIESTNSYSQDVGRTLFHYPDTNKDAVEICCAQAAYNKGAHDRQKVVQPSTAANPVNVVTLSNR